MLEGKNPGIGINNQQGDYSSCYYFIRENGYGLGFEESYYRGIYDTTYEFSWYWYDNSYRLMVLNYSSPEIVDTAYIEIFSVQNGQLKGWFYDSYNDYVDYKKNQSNTSDRKGVSVEWKLVDNYDKAYVDKLLNEWRNKKAESYIPFVTGSGNR